MQESLSVYYETKIYANDSFIANDTMGRCIINELDKRK